MGDPRLLEQIFDRKMLAVLKLFLSSAEDLYLREIAKKARVPPASTHRILKRLLALGLISQVKVKRFKLYRLIDNDSTRFLQEILKEDRHLIGLFVERVKGIAGISAIILHGKEQKDRANLLIIGEDINSDELKRQSGLIKEEYDFSISTLSLTREQFGQMSSMGLYPGQKKVIYKRG
ncbi:helix-turn-helix domain-containing protein [Candidatus Woesearchaeota archaeon]|nr:helix-turn-helix domain-containing protein [Candidatus Woesearchaeota archaeon]